MNEHLTDIVNRLASQITEQEGRDRKRNGEAQAHFLQGDRTPYYSALERHSNT